ncbi:TatD family hydrolase [Candidatus Vondammii sp. HM_W22]|uniref:TatD family hydrolase n=1 Tax=Candidatus Vondammii sp. HM_W22 TaxID=2687299 RepID=UPI00403D6E70
MPAIKAAWWPRVRQLCNSHTRFYPAYGLHPTFMESHQAGDIENLELWLRQEKPVAIGECGLYFFIENPDRADAAI